MGIGQVTDGVRVFRCPGTAVSAMSFDSVFGLVHLQ